MRHTKMKGSVPRGGRPYPGGALSGLSARALAPRGVWLGLAAAASAAVLWAVVLWAAAAGSQEPAEPLWSADMTVVEYTSVSIGAATADLFSNVGGSGDLQIKSLWSHTPDRDLRLAFQDDVSDAADYTLQVGDLFLEFPAGSSGAASFKWSGVDVDWEDGQLIRVQIVLTADVASAADDSVAVNSAATGEPAVNGTARVGETLTADTSAITDEDGLDGVSYHYQWMRADADIAGATESAYTLGDDDEGETIKVAVSFIDDNGNSEMLTSAATLEVRERPQFLVSNLNAGVAGAGGVQRTLNAARSGFAQAFTTGPRTGGYPLGSVSIQFTHLFDASTAADGLEVTINGAADDSGPGDALCTLVDPSSFSAPALVAFDAPTGADACMQLAAETTYFVAVEWTDPSGTDAFALIPQTYPTDESAATAEDPGGADGWSIADHSYYLSVSSEVRTWTAYDETASFKIKVNEGAASANTAATGLPAVTGTPQVGETLTADASAIDDADGLANVEYEYQWIAGGADIDGATASTYELTESEQGETITVRVTFSDDADNTETLTSEATEEVAAAPNTAPTGLPAVTGTPRVGETLTADTSAIDDADGLDSVSYEYQWIAGGVDIGGATASGYELTEGEQGETVAVRVAFTDDAGNDESLISEATEEVAAEPVRLTVSVTASAPATHDGSSEFTFDIEFSEEFGLSYRTLKFHAFNVTGATIQRTQRTDRPSNISWRITVRPTSTGDVVIELPVTTDCNAEGAICTGDRRKLSNSLSFTIKGANPPTTCSPPQTLWACPAGGQLRPSTP